jgi:hypothetical protein
LDQSEIDEGTIAALMIRMKEYRLPRAKRMLERVRGGQTLSSEDIAFLKRVHSDSRNTQALVKRNPQYNELIVRMMDLYTEIITKGLENEKASSGNT